MACLSSQLARLILQTQRDNLVLEQYARVPSFAFLSKQYDSTRPRQR